MATAIKDGKKREDFLIDKAAAAAVSARKRGAFRKRRKK
jgi:hypothetical protein